MGKDRVLRTVVILQGICMIVLAVVVVSRVLSPPEEPHVQGPPKDSGKPSEAVGKIAATVGKEQITEAELSGELKSLYGDSVLRTLMVRAAVRQEAAAYGLEVSPEELDEELETRMEGYGSEQQYYSAMKDQLGLTPGEVREDAKYRLLLDKIATRTIHVSDQEIDAYIKANKAQFEPKTQYRLAWILTDSKQDADSVLSKLENGEDFGLMAKTYSVDADTASNGGELGLIDSNDPFADSGILKAAAAMKLGEITGPVAVTGGEAVIRLEEKRTEGAMSDEKKRDAARKQVALSKASPVRDVEDELLAKYNAAVVQ